MRCLCVPQYTLISTSTVCMCVCEQASGCICECVCVFEKQMSETTTYETYEIDQNTNTCYQCHLKSSLRRAQISLANHIKSEKKNEIFSHQWEMRTGFDCVYLWVWVSSSVCVSVSVFVCMPNAADCSLTRSTYLILFLCVGQEQKGFSVSSENCYQNWTTGIDPKI